MHLLKLLEQSHPVHLLKFLEQRHIVHMLKLLGQRYLVEVHNSCELFSDDLERDSRREGWFVVVTRAVWLVFVARDRALRRFLVVPPSRSVVFPMARVFVFVGRRHHGAASQIRERPILFY